jgi:hypothetical protein
MIPWRSTQVIEAFVAGLLAIAAAKEGLMYAGAPLVAAVFGLALAGFSAVAVVLALALGAGLSRNRLRQAVRRGRSEVRALCETFLAAEQGAADRRSRVEQPLFLDDPPSAEVARLRRALAGLGVRATAAEVREYLFWCRFAQRRAGRVATARVRSLAAERQGRRLQVRRAG